MNKNLKKPNRTTFVPENKMNVLRNVFPFVSETIMTLNIYDYETYENKAEEFQLDC